MSENSDKNSELIQLLLDKCDRLYQENQKLKSQLDPALDVEVIKAGYEKTISHQQNRIASLDSTVAYLRRRIRGKSSERFVNEDPHQRRIDFDGLELLPQEQELAEKAQEEISSFLERRTRECAKDKSVRKSLPENLPRIEEYIYPTSDDFKNRKTGRSWSRRLTKYWNTNRINVMFVELSVTSMYSRIRNRKLPPL